MAKEHKFSFKLKCIRHPKLRHLYKACRQLDSYVNFEHSKYLTGNELALIKNDQVLTKYQLGLIFHGTTNTKVLINSIFDYLDELHKASIQEERTLDRAKIQLRVKKCVKSYTVKPNGNGSFTATPNFSIDKHIAKHCHKVIATCQRKLKHLSYTWQRDHYFAVEMAKNTYAYQGFIPDKATLGANPVDNIHLILPDSVDYSFKWIMKFMRTHKYTEVKHLFHL